MKKVKKIKSIDDALVNLANIMLSPEEFIDDKELLKEALFELKFTTQKEFEILFDIIKKRTYDEILNNNSCVWENKDTNNILYNSLKNCEISNCVVPSNLKFNIDLNGYEIIDMTNEKIKKISLTKLS